MRWRIGSMSLIDKLVEKDFLDETKLVCDEVIVYAGKRTFYSSEFEGYENFYRVVTINERNGVVTKYLKQGDDPVGGRWFSSNMK